MSLSQWRQFTFFDVVPVKDIHDLGSSPEVFKVSLPVGRHGDAAEGMEIC